MLRAAGAALLLSALLAAPSRALEVPPLEGRVNDRAGLLDAGTRARLEQRLAEFEQRSGRQLAVLTLPSLEGDPIEDFSIRVVEAWQLGDAERDDGLLLLVALAERQVRIEVGYGLEGQVPDAIAARIIRGEIQPAFRRGDHAGGIEAALEALMRRAEGEPYEPRREGGFALGWVVLLVFVALALLVLISVSSAGPGPPAAGGQARRRSRRTDHDDLWIGGHPGGGWRGGGWGGGGFGGGGLGGGGFSGGGGGLGGGGLAGGGCSGGGGGFGGGGASGGW